MRKTNYQEIEYKGKNIQKQFIELLLGIFRAWGKNSKCNKPKDFNLSCGSWGYIKEIK